MSGFFGSTLCFLLFNFMYSFDGVVYNWSSIIFVNSYMAHPPIGGIVEYWDLMERFIEQVIFKYLRAEPEDHYFLLVSTTYNFSEEIFEDLSQRMAAISILHCQCVNCKGK